MLNRLLACTMILAVVSEPISAQLPEPPTPPRVRISGARDYEVPGVIKLHDGRLTGSSIVMDKNTARVVSRVDGSTLVVLNPGKRQTGQVLDVKDRIVVLLPDGQQDAIRMPLESIGKLEVPKRSGLRTGLRTARGIAVGYAVMMGVSGLLLQCDSNTCFTLGLTAGTGAAIAAGVLAGRGEDWQRVSPDWLLSQFAGPEVDQLAPTTSRPSRQRSANPVGTRESTPSPSTAREPQP